MSLRQLAFAPWLLFASVLTLAKSVIYARVLEVHEFGSLTRMLVVAATAATVLGAGFNQLAHKLLPAMHGRHDDAGRADMLAVNLGVPAVVAAALILISAAFDAIGLRGPAGFGLAAVTLSFAQYVFAVRIIDLKSAFRFSLYGAWSTVRAGALISCGALVALATRDATSIILTEACITLALALPLVIGKDGAPVFQRVVRPMTLLPFLREHARAAMLLLSLQGVVAALYLVDRWIGIGVLSAREYGLYAVGIVVLTAFETLQAIVTMPAYPVLSRLVSSGQLREAYRYAVGASLVVFGALAVLCLVLAAFAEVSLRTVLPKYAGAEPIVQLALLAGAVRASNFMATLCILCNRERLMLVLAIVWIGVIVGAAFAGDALGLFQLGPAQVMGVAVAVSLLTLSSDFVVASRAVRSGIAP